MPEIYDDKGNPINEVYDDNGNPVVHPNIQSQGGVINNFILRHLDELGQTKPGILNPDPMKNPLLMGSQLPETTASPGLLGGARHWAYENLVRPLASPLGVLGMFEGSDIPTEPIGTLPHDIQLPPIEKTAELPTRKMLPPASSIQLGTGPLSEPSKVEGGYYQTGKPMEQLHPNRIEPASEIITPNEVVKQAAKSPDPIIQSAAKDTDGIIDKVKAAQPFTAVEERFNQQGPAGQIINQKIARMANSGPMIASQNVAKIKSEIPPGILQDADHFSKIVDIVEGKEKGSAEDQGYADAISSVLNNLGKQLEDSGVSLKTLSGEKVPFKRRSDYFPHQYPEGFWEQPDLINKLVDGGMDRNDAYQVVQNARKFGEQTYEFQRQRIPDLEGYDKTPDVLFNYINRASQRISMANELGPEDINGPELSKLIEDTKDPQYTLRLLRRVIPGRDDPMSLTEQAMQPINSAASKMSTLFHLSRFALSKVNTSIPMIMRGNAKDFISELTKTLFKSGYASDIQSSTGITHSLADAVMDEVNRGGARTGYYGGRSIDNFFRTVASGMGKATAEDVFSKLKNNPNDSRSLARLSNLVLEDPTRVANQPNLTEKQLNMAGARFAELTQGLPEARKVPLAFSEPLLQIPLIFKKYAFQHGKIIKDAVMENPVRNIPLLLGLSQVFGEAVGDAKTTLKSLGLSLYKGTDFSDEFGDEYAKRGDFFKRFTGDTSASKTMSHPIIDHLLDNISASWVAGLGTDILDSLGSKSGLAETLAGPAIGDVGNLGYQASQGNLRNIGRFGVQNLPILGSSDLSREVLPTPAQPPFRLKPPNVQKLRP